MSGHRNKTGLKTKQKQTLVKIVIITFQTISVIKLKWNQGTLDMSQYQTKECPLKSMNRVH